MTPPIFHSYKERYSRQMLIKGWNQEKLTAASVLIVGMGGLGCASASYLTGAGVGRLRLCDGGKVELSNLNRQLLYTEESVGKYKVEEALKRLKALNPEVDVQSVPENLSSSNIDRIATKCDIIIDGVDNHETRLLLNRQSIKMQIPLIFGAVLGWQGFVGVFLSPRTACLACILPHMSEHSRPVPVTGVLPGMVGLVQAAEGLKMIMGGEQTLSSRLFVLDSGNLSFEVVEMVKKSDCPVCSHPGNQETTHF